MEKLIKRVLMDSYRSFKANYQEINTVEDMLNSFALSDIGMILEETEDEYSLEMLVRFANDVVQELKAKDAEKQTIKEERPYEQPIPIDNGL